MSELVAEARRRQILDAAVRVFADRGFHDTRVHDVAREAGVAYGLVYHYFGSKSALLQAAFDHNWAIFADVVEAIAASDRAPSDALRAVADYVFGAFEAYPHTVKVLVLEFGRTRRLGEALEHPDVARVTVALRDLFRAARDAGGLAEGADPSALAALFLGGLEAAIASAVLPGVDAEHGRARLGRMHRSLVVLFGEGLFHPAASAPHVP